jgi:hypothetical protein
LVKALVLALLVATCSDTTTVDVRGPIGSVGLAQYTIRMRVLKPLCPNQEDALHAWWFYEVRGAPVGGRLTLYDARGRALDDTAPCDLWMRRPVDVLMLHAFWNVSPGKVYSATYVTPSGAVIPFKRSQ